MVNPTFITKIFALLKNVWLYRQFSAHLYMGGFFFFNFVVIIVEFAQEILLSVEGLETQKRGDTKQADRSAPFLARSATE